MARIITGEIAKKIRRKLKATKAGDRSGHDLYEVREKGEVKISFTIRRASEKDKGNDHIPKQLRINAHKAKCLAQCSYTRSAYLKDLGD